MLLVNDEYKYFSIKYGVIRLDSIYEELMNKQMSQYNLNDFDFICVTFSDMNGCHMTKMVPSEENERVRTNDVNLYGGAVLFGIRNQYVPINELEENKSRNAFLKVDMNTLAPSEWANSKYGHKMGEIIADLYWDDTTPVDFYVRNIAKIQLERLQECGYRLYSAFEPEFRAFKRDPIYEPYTRGLDLYKTTLLTTYQDYLMIATKYLCKSGVPIQDCCTEHGEGQLETPIMPCEGITSADHMFRAKQAFKDIALRCTDDMMISFMTRPFPSESCSGNHFNHSLLDAATGQPVMFDLNEPYKLSKVSRYWINGILKHLPAITALCCPTTNCYKRLHEFIAPTVCNWDIDDRFCSIRVKANSAKVCYVENRLPSSAASPYLVLAATIAAGIDGLNCQIEPPLPGKSDLNATKLPTSLEEALDVLEQDSIIMDTLGRKPMEYFIKIKRQIDVAHLKSCGTDPEEILNVERYLYFDYV